MDELAVLLNERISHRPLLLPPLPLHLPVSSPASHILPLHFAAICFMRETSSTTHSPSSPPTDSYSVYEMSWPYSDSIWVSLSLPTYCLSCQPRKTHHVRPPFIHPPLLLHRRHRNCCFLSSSSPCLVWNLNSSSRNHPAWAELVWARHLFCFKVANSWHHLHHWACWSRLLRSYKRELVTVIVIIIIVSGLTARRYWLFAFIWFH